MAPHATGTEAWRKEVDLRRRLARALMGHIALFLALPRTAEILASVDVISLEKLSLLLVL
jgi:hypothetical protein